MKYEAEPMEFPGFADLPRREKSKLSKVWDFFNELKSVSEEKGMLIPQTFAALLLDVSRQRVNQLVEDGRLETHTFNQVPFVTENSVVRYAQGERKAGRPLKFPTTMRESLKRAKKREK